MGRSNTNNSTKKTSNNTKSAAKPKPLTGATVEEIIKQNGAHNIFGLNSSQKILNIIRGAFKEEVNNPEFPDKLRLIKEHFFNREYAKIFENPDYLACYCLNYIPGRSLCYFNMFLQNEALRELLKGKLSIFAMGAGAGSELMGIASAGSVMYNENQKITLNTQDIANWSRELNCLENELREQLGQNLNGLETKFSTGSVLNIDEQLEKNINESDLITAMFVINELFVEKTNAMKLITLLISKMKSGSHLLIVDSAGSFSHLKINDKTYMVHQLLDNLKNYFEPLIQKDSEWYRIPSNINFPLPIQNMRYFIRLYKRL